MDGTETNDTRVMGSEDPRTPIAEQIIRIYATEPIAELTMRIFSKSAEQAIRTVLTESVSAASSQEQQPAGPAAATAGATKTAPVEIAVAEEEVSTESPLTPNGNEDIAPSLQTAMSGWMDLAARFQQAREAQAAAAREEAEQAEQPCASAPGPEDVDAAEPAESLIARVAGGLLQRDQSV